MNFFLEPPESKHMIISASLALPPTFIQLYIFKTRAEKSWRNSVYPVEHIPAKIEGERNMMRGINGTPPRLHFPSLQFQSND